MKELDDRDHVAVRFEGVAGGDGELRVTAWANGFAGRAGAWFNHDTVVRFAEALTAYPLPDEPPAIAAGTWTRDGALDQELVRIEARRVGNRGQVALWLHLSGPGDWPPSENDVRLELKTTYQRMRGFGEDLGRVVRGELVEARIEGERLA